MACKGVQSAVNYFKGLGYLEQFNINLVIQDEVKTPDLDWRVFGFFNAAKNQIFMSTFGTDYTNARTVFYTDGDDPTTGLALNEELWTSIVTHEAAHAIVQQLWNKQEANQYKIKLGLRLNSGPHEFVAYAVQILSLSDATRNELLAHYGETANAFDYATHINSISHFSGPHKFGVRSYNYFMKNEGSELIRNIIGGSFDPDAAIASF